MSPVAKAAAERTLMAMNAAMVEQVEASRSLQAATMRHFGLDPEAPANPLHDDQEPSPAVFRFIHDETPFEIDAGFYSIDTVLASGSDPQTDVLLFSGYEHVDGDELPCRRALRLRDLEALIMDDRVNIPFLGTARQYNLDRGWANGGRTLASLGILFGGEA